MMRKGLLMRRISGWEDEYKITEGKRVLTLEELLYPSPRAFFSQHKHALVGQRREHSFPQDDDPSDYDASRTDCTWTWYGGKVYDEQDALVEASTPPISIERQPVHGLLQAIILGRAQIAELAEGYQAEGVSSQLNFMLDSEFFGDDLCDESKYVDRQIPSQGLTLARSHKLGADICKIMVRTFGPAIAFLFFNPFQNKGAIYRPRGHRRIELSLPYAPRHDQIAAGALLWFGAVEHTTHLIKEDLASYGVDYSQEFLRPDYFQRILAKLPWVVTGLRLKSNVSFRLGYEVADGYEKAVREQGSEAKIATSLGEIPVSEVLQRAIDLVHRDLPRFGTPAEIALLEEFARGMREPNVDLRTAHPHVSLSRYVTDYLREPPTSYLNRQRVRWEEFPLAGLVTEPYRQFPSGERRLLVRRNLGEEIDWQVARLEVTVEDYARMRLRLLELHVPREELPEYFRYEWNARDGEAYLSQITRWVHHARELAYPSEVFVWGTLKSKETTERAFGIRVLKEQDAEAMGTLYDLGKFPILIESPSDTTPVFGKVMEMEDVARFFAESDQYEGANLPNPYFLRVLREVRLAQGGTALVWMYVGNPNNPDVRTLLSPERIIKSGVWEREESRL